MHSFRKPNLTKSVMFAGTYEDGRTAYMVGENHGPPSEDYLAGAIARERQATGALPDGAITGVKRVR